MLLAQASFQLGRGKKTFMLLSTYLVVSDHGVALISFPQLLRSVWRLRWICTANSRLA
jgi:hypothetical protein